MTERRVGEIVRQQRPVTLHGGDSVREACLRMRDRRVGAVLVVDDEERLIGIFTGRDAVARVLAEGRDPAHTVLASVMTPEPVTLPPRCTAIEALRMMQDCGFRHIPICEHGRLRGVVSRGDFRGLEHARLDDETGFWERIG